MTLRFCFSPYSPRCSENNRARHVDLCYNNSAFDLNVGVSNKSRRTWVMSRKICAANMSQRGIALVLYSVARPLGNSSNAKSPYLAWPRTQNTGSLSNSMVLSSATTGRLESACPFGVRSRSYETQLQNIHFRIKTFSRLDFKASNSEYTYSFGK